MVKLQISRIGTNMEIEIKNKVQKNKLKKT